jgi:hypothetical protein
MTRAENAKRRRQLAGRCLRTYTGSFPAVRMSALWSDGIAVHSEEDDRQRALLATVSGNADLSSRMVLDQFLTSLHEQTRQRDLRKVVVDVTKLAFLNSSCLKSLVSWIIKIKALPPDQRYQVTFLSCQELNWQKRSLFAILSLAPELVTIE